MPTQVNQCNMKLYRVRALLAVLERLYAGLYTYVQTASQLIRSQNYLRILISIQ